MKAKHENGWRRQLAAKAASRKRNINNGVIIINNGE